MMQGVLFSKNAKGQLTQQALFDTVVPPMDAMASPVPFTF
jgi:hypothetical protein